MLWTEKICGPKVKPNKVIAHRGMSGKFPENTLLAFDAARHAGLRWLETDISLLADETLIVFHDEAQGRTVAGDKLVADANWEDFQDEELRAIQMINDLSEAETTSNKPVYLSKEEQEAMKISKESDYKVLKWFAGIALFFLAIKILSN